MKNEKCVLCGKETTEVKGEIVGKRVHYIEGAGQLCDKCYKRVYGK